MNIAIFKKRFVRLISNPMYYVKLFLKMFILKTSKYWSDTRFIKIMYWIRTGDYLKLKNPVRFIDKQNWLKLHDRNPLYTQLVDKYLVKKYVSNCIGEEYVVPCLGHWNSPDEIDFDKLPNKFVLKCNHNSGGGMCICKDKNSLDFNLVRNGLRKGLLDDFFKYSRVWPYKNVQRCIIADMFLDDHTGNELRDYKFLCFNGVPKIMYCTNKGDNIYENFYDMEFNPLDITHGYPRITPEIEKPKEFDLMKELATKLSKNIPFVRVDFFNVDGHVYFGEFTFFDWGAMKPMNDKWEILIGSWIDINNND